MQINYVFGQFITPHVRCVLLARFFTGLFLFLVPIIARELRRRKRQRQHRKKNDLIGRMRKNNRAARAAHTLVEFFDVVYQTTT